MSNNNGTFPQILIPEIGEIPRFETVHIPACKWKDGVLVRTPNWLGDAVMAIPAVMQLKKLIPSECGVFILCPKGMVPIFEALPQIADRVIPLSNPHAFLNAAERLTLRRLQCGAGFVFNNSFRDVLSLRMTGIRPLFGTDARFRRFMLKRAFSFPPRLDRVWNKPHQAAKYLSMVYAAGAPDWNGLMPEFQDLSDPAVMTDDVRAAVSADHVLCVAAGAAYGGAKRWPGKSFSAVCRRWICEQHGNVVLLGSGNERQAAEEIRSDLPEGKALNLAGKTNLTEVIALLKRASVCLANDSGLMHLAAALGTPGVAPFGPTDPAATGPLSNQWRLICRKIECAPCFKRECPQGTKKCFDGVTPDIVFENLLQVKRRKSC